MDRFRPIFSKTIALSRLNPSHVNRYSQIVRPFSIQHTDSRRKRINSFPRRGEQNHSVNRCIAQWNSTWRSFASEVGTDTHNLPQVDFEQYCAETLESLTDHFDEVVEKFNEFEAADVVYKVTSVDTKRTNFTHSVCFNSFYLFNAGWSVDGELGKGSRNLRDK